jgi:hypothetical protein
MFSSKSAKQATPSAAVAPNRSPAKLAVMPKTHPPQDRIRERAYELYERRGREPGQHEQDWLQAEREILSAER